MADARLCAGFLSAMAVAGCASEALQGRGVLPPPPSDPVELASVRSPHPFAFPTDRSGAFVRTLLVSEDDPGFRVTVRDLGIPPKQPTHPITVSGPSVLEMLSEGGTINMEKQSTDLHGGSWLAVPAKTPFALVNRSDHSVYARLYTIEVKP